MPNAHNLTGYGPTQLWVLRTSRYVVLGKALATSQKSGRESVPAVLYPAFNSQNNLQIQVHHLVEDFLDEYGGIDFSKWEMILFNGEQLEGPHEDT
jgi:hypothetical protein